MKSEKIQKVLARAGYGSRREIERWIEAGRVRVNQQTATLGDRVSLRDKIFLDNELCQLADPEEKLRVLMYHKPVGQVCTRSDPEGRDTVFDHLPSIHNGRWINVGRLDINTSGLLLFTNNGELAHALMHPSRQIQREYAARVIGHVTPEIIERLTQGVQLEDGKARFEDVVDSGGKGVNHWFHMVVVQGRNHIVRRLWQSQNITVNRLMRVRFGSVFLPKSLRQSSWVELDEKVIEKLQHEAGV